MVRALGPVFFELHTQGVLANNQSKLSHEEVLHFIDMGIVKVGHAFKEAPIGEKSNLQIIS